MVRFKPQDTLLIDVIDTGIGMSPEFQRQAFDRFSQVDTSESRSYGGIGLGLSICHELLEEAGGSITVSSHLGQGSSFQVRLPVTVQAEMKSEDVGDARVLLVEDNVETARLMIMILKRSTITQYEATATAATTIA